MRFNKQLERLKLLSDNSCIDRESAHQEADKILCDILQDLGYKEIIEAFKNIDKWYS